MGKRRSPLTNSACPTTLAENGFWLGFVSCSPSYVTSLQESKCTLIFFKGNAVELAARDWRIWAVSRIFTGMGNGLVQTQCVIYVAEVAPIAIR